MADTTTNIKFYKVDSLPTSGYVTGGVYFVTGEKVLYVRTADSWIKYDGDLDTKLLDKADNEITYTTTVDGEDVSQTDTVANWITGLLGLTSMTYSGMTQNGDAIAEIRGKIPAEASSANQLADKAYVDNKSLSLCVSITWSELKALRDGANLVPGQSYRITDYVTTTAQDATQSAGHQFDVIVTADDESTLNENARACLHEGDIYFASCYLNVWRLKYCLDNDTARFGWATQSGKGVIYQMIDEWGNDLPYDFKNIQFRMDEVASDDPIRKSWDLNRAGDVWYRAVYGSSKWTKKTGNSIYAYTFNKATITDDVLTLTDASISDVVYDNSIGRRGNAKQYLNEIVWIPYNSTQVVEVHGNHFGENNYRGCMSTYSAHDCKTGNDCIAFICGNGCSNWKIGSRCSSWICGHSCYGWSCGGSCYSWTCGHDCAAWVCGYACYNWTCGNSCYGWTCGNYCYKWTCGASCHSWSCKYGSSSWTCGNSCYNWSCGAHCYEWICENNCSYWTCGDLSVCWKCGYSCSSWSCGCDCSNWTCSQYCYRWSCGNSCCGWTCADGCYLWSCGNYCSFWKCDGNCDAWNCGNNCCSWICGVGCRRWTCGNNCSNWVTGAWSDATAAVQHYIENFSLATGTSYVGIKASTSTTSSTPLKNFAVKRGIAGTESSRLNIVIDTADFPLNSDYEWTIAKNSSEEIKQYCEADLIS